MLLFDSRIGRGRFESLAPASGAEVGRFMKHTAKYTDEALGRLEIVKDFLPPPDQLVPKEDGVKVTLSLSKRSVAFFKAHAARSKVPYQKMIRSLVDSYAAQYEGATSSNRIERSRPR